jgi:hypothetical protein
MKIQIVGSIDQDLPNERQAEIMAACRAIGEELARQKHEIIVGSDHPVTADLYIVEGANRLKPKRTTKVSVVSPEGGERRHSDQRPQHPYKDQEARLPNIKFLHVSTSGTWQACHLQATQRADAVLAIGGKEATEITGNYAFLLEKPLLPVAALGGSAEGLWHKYKQLYSTVGFTDDESTCLFKSWRKDSSPSYLTSALKKVTATNPFSNGSHETLQTLRGPLVWFGIGVALLVSWQLIYHFGENDVLPQEIAIVPLVLISALLGSIFRQLQRMKETELSKINIRVLIAEMLGGLILSFALVLVFYFSVITITGAPISFSKSTDTHAAVDTFRRLSITLGLLSFGAAFLPEDATKILMERLKRALSASTQPHDDRHGPPSS